MSTRSDIRSDAAHIAFVRDRIGRVINQHYIENAVRDILTDLRHYCDAADIDYAEEDRIAYQNYLAELEGAQS